MKLSNNKPKGAGPGRPKGSKNVTTMKRVAEILSEAGKHPVTELLALIPTLTEKEQATVWMALLKYIEAPALPKESELKDIPVITYKVDDGSHSN